MASPLPPTTLSQSSTSESFLLPARSPRRAPRTDRRPSHRAASLRAYSAPPLSDHAERIELAHSSVPPISARVLPARWASDAAVSLLSRLVAARAPGPACGHLRTWASAASFSAGVGHMHARRLGATDVGGARRVHRGVGDTQIRWSLLLRPRTARDIGGQAATPDSPSPPACSVSSFQRTRLSSISAYLSPCFLSSLMPAPLLTTPSPQDDQRSQINAVHRVDRARHVVRRLQRRRVQPQHPRRAL